MKTFVLFFGFACCFQQGSTAQHTTYLIRENATIYSYKTPDREGTGKVYMGREIALMEHASKALAYKFDTVKLYFIKLAINKMQLRPTDVVADIGAGTGNFRHCWCSIRFWEWAAPTTKRICNNPRNNLCRLVLLN
jgi:hypothetical protein